MIGLSFNELTSNPERYAGKRVSVDGAMVLWSVQSYYELYVAPFGAAGGKPYNPICEYTVSFLGLHRITDPAPSSRIIEGCVPRSKVWSLAGAWAGEHGVRVVGVVSPRQDDPSRVFVRDALIVQPRENTSEKWPDER